MNLGAFLKYAVPSWWALIPFRRPEGKIAVLNTVWSHHAKRSGYHPIAEGLGLALPAYTQLIPATISRWIAGKELDVAYQVALALKIAHRDCLLITNGDDNLKLIVNIRRVTSIPVYAVFHHTPSTLEQILADTPPLLVDGAICVARCQVPVIQRIAPPGRTWFVPHGVDTEYFTPRTALSNQPSVLCAGVHQRDFDTLRKSADLIMRAVSAVSVRLIAPRAYLPPELNLGPVKLITDVSDKQLLEEYRRAWVVLLPLKDSTANNSLLESMACGRPIVASDIGGVRDYAGVECGALCAPGDAHAHAAATIDLLLDPMRREAAGRAARAKAQAFAWPAIRAQIRKLLANPV